MREVNGGERLSAAAHQALCGTVMCCADSQMLLCPSPAERGGQAASSTGRTDSVTASVQVLEPKCPYSGSVQLLGEQDKCNVYSARAKV